MLTNISHADTEAEIRRLIQSGDCKSAASLAPTIYREEYLAFTLGAIEQYCEKNISKAIQWYRYGVMFGGEFSKLSEISLIKLGEVPPSAQRNENKPDLASILKGMSCVAGNKQDCNNNGQTIIIQQQPSYVLPNPSACIQDGG